MLDKLRTPQVTLALACYNEEESIARVIGDSVSALETLKLDWEIIVIDNASQDDTAGRVRELAEADDRIRLIVHDRNRLYSGSCQTAMREARGKYVAFMDTDGQFTARDLPKFIAQIQEGFGLVLGWRRVRHDPVFRKLASLVFNAMGYWYLKSPVHDLNVGIRMLSGDLAKRVQIQHAINAVNPELLVRAMQEGARIGEVEAEHADREEGESCHSLQKTIGTFLAMRRYLHTLSRELAAGRSETIRAGVDEPHLQVPNRAGPRSRRLEREPAEAA